MSSKKQKRSPNLKGQVAVVTGATSGIGKSIALALAEMGVHLILLGRDLDRLNSVRETARRESTYAESYAVDLTRKENIFCFVKKIERSFDTVDILVHSAGLIYTGALESATVADFDEQYRVNVRAPFLLIQRFLPMLRAGKGQIVFINSTAGLRPGRHNGLYAATKSALKSLADSFRDELNNDGIRVLSVYPGRTATPMQRALIGRDEYRLERLLRPEDVTAAVISALSLPRSAEVTDITIRPLSKVI
jgi:NADP-dependent 3-hydroxy acid dehydrogenase YdfG